MGARRIAAACAAWGLACALAAGAAPEASREDRGEALYELRCLGCHSRSIHGRERRAASDFAQVRAWVERWNASLGLRWDAGEVEDVAAYLNRRYYRYACPPSACRTVSLAPRAAVEDR